MSANPVIVDFQKKTRRSYVHAGKGVYENPANGHFFGRPMVRGKQTFRKLNATTLRAAQLELGKLKAEQAMARAGLAKDPFAPQSESWSVGQVLDFYLKYECPNCRRRSTSTRTEAAAATETRHIEMLRQWWAPKDHAEITQEDCGKYHKWRVAKITRGTGDRQVDVELVTLSNAFRWAVRNFSKTGVRSNPIGHDRGRFADPDLVKHCRDWMPRDADELHNLARYLFQSADSEALGWLLLMQAFIGQRVGEIVQLRWDAKNENEAGFIRGKHLFLYRSRPGSTKGTFPYALIHSALAQCLERLRAWRDDRYPESPWFFPSPVDPLQPVCKTSLTAALNRICPLMGLPKRTSHGLRSFFVNVLRSDRDREGRPRMSDSEIGLRIGHKSGEKLIVQVYGDILPYKLTWMPENVKPGWDKYATQLELPL